MSRAVSAEEGCAGEREDWSLPGCACRGRGLRSAGDCRSRPGVGGGVSGGAGHHRHAPIACQPMTQPAITKIIAQVGIGGMPRAPRPPNSSWPGPPPGLAASAAGRSGNGGRPPGRAAFLMPDDFRVDNVHGRQS